MPMLHPVSTDPLVSRFNQDGYLVLRDVLAPETVGQVQALLQGEIDRSVAQLGERLGMRAGPALVRHINQTVGSPELDRLDKLARDVMTGHFPLEVRLSPVLWAIPQDRGLRQVLTTLLASDELYMHMPPTARFVLPGNAQAGVPAHADSIYNEHITGFITVWVPLVEITEQCGGVAVYPGSGRVEQQVGKTAGKFWLDAVPTDGLGEQQHILCKPRDILIMSNHVIHVSMPNVSDATRISIDLRFFGASGHSTKHVLDMQSWRVVAPAEQWADEPV